jgi:Bacterial type II/III secretion system short domain
MRLRFSIRDLLWLTALAAVLLAWWLDHRSLAGYSRTVTYQLSVADSSSVAKVLETMLEGVSGVGIAIDSRNNSVVVTGPPEQQAVIRNLVDKMEGKSSAGGTATSPSQFKVPVPIVPSGGPH